TKQIAAVFGEAGKWWTLGDAAPLESWIVANALFPLREKYLRALTSLHLRDAPLASKMAEGLAKQLASTSLDYVMWMRLAGVKTSCALEGVFEGGSVVIRPLTSEELGARALMMNWFWLFLEIRGAPRPTMGVESHVIELRVRYPKTQPTPLEVRRIDCLI